MRSRRHRRDSLLFLGASARLVEAEPVDKMRVDRVMAAPVAEDLPGDLRRTSDEEVEAPDVRAVVPRRGRDDEGMS